MKTVYAYVCADLLHEGHLQHLENSKALGDKLIVGVLTDEAVMEKKEKPTMSFSERAKLVKALRCVDIVVPQHEYSPLKNIKALQPDILVESTGHIGNSYLKELKKMFKGRVVMFPYFPGISSTEIKNRIKNESQSEKGGTCSYC